MNQVTNPPRVLTIAEIQQVGKGGKARTVPLWWDADTLADLRASRRIAAAIRDRGKPANSPPSPPIG